MPMPTPTPTVAKAADERERLFEPPRRFRAHTLDRFLQLCAKRLRGTEQRQTFVEPQNAFEFECDTLIVSGFELRTLATLRDLCLQISKCLCFIGSDRIVWRAFQSLVCFKLHR